MSKPKPIRAVPTQHTGIYKPDSVKDAADFLNLSVSDAVASALASDAEYRIHQIVEEAARFMRHGRRTTMTTSDIDQALRVLNVEPLYGHTPYNPPVFRRAAAYSTTGSSSAPANSGPVYFIEDEEIDFDRVLREEKIALPKSVNWTAHWLAVEGVQPLIPENPPAIPRESDLEVFPKVLPQAQVNGASAPAATSAKKIQAQAQQQLVKQVLSKELQLYYGRLTSSLLPPSSSDFAKRTAALASLRTDAGLQSLLPYLIRWVGEGVVGALREGVPDTEEHGKVLEVLLDVIAAILENKTLFVEPYLHQILPSILSTLLHASLPSSHAKSLRTSASQTLSRLLTQHSTTYPSLAPRIMKTLLLALISPSKNSGTREGAIQGLVGVGKEAVRKGLVEGGGAKVVGSECAANPDLEPLANSVMDALGTLRSNSAMTENLDPDIPEDQETIAQLRETLGDYFAERLMGDRAWARSVLQGENAE